MGPNSRQILEIWRKTSNFKKTPNGPRSRGGHLTRVSTVILSDKDLRAELSAGRIIIEPFDDTCVQPSSIDVKVAPYFRVFRNHSAAVLDVKQDLTGLTELVERALLAVWDC